MAIPISFETLGGAQSVQVARAQLNGADIPRAPLVLIAPAMGLRASYYRQLIEGLVACGFHAAAIDHPGHGDSPIRASRKNNWGYGELVRHFAGAREAVCRACPESPCYWLGHSLGGQVALMDAGGAQGAIAGVLLVASGSPWWRAWNGVASLRVAAGTSFSGVLATALGHYPGEHVGFGGREARRVIQQWARVGITGSYRFSDFDGEQLLNQCTVPVHVVRLAADPYAPARAINHTLDKLSAPPVAHVLWDRDLPTGNVHNRWPRNPQFAIEQARRFVTSGASTGFD